MQIVHVVCQIQWTQTSRFMPATLLSEWHSFCNQFQAQPSVHGSSWRRPAINFLVKVLRPCINHNCLALDTSKPATPFHQCFLGSLLSAVTVSAPSLYFHGTGRQPQSTAITAVTKNKGPCFCWSISNKDNATEDSPPGKKRRLHGNHGQTSHLMLIQD